MPLPVYGEGKRSGIIGEIDIPRRDFSILEKNDAGFAGSRRGNVAGIDDETAVIDDVLPIVIGVIGDDHHTVRRV